MSEEQNAAEPSGAKKDAPESSHGQDGPKVTSAVPERVEGQMNPSSPGNTGTTPGTNAKVG